MLVCPLTNHHFVVLGIWTYCLVYAWVSSLPLSYISTADVHSHRNAHGLTPAVHICLGVVVEVVDRVLLSNKSTLASNS